MTNKIQQLVETAHALVAPGKGILAMDESNPTCGKRLASVDVENSEDNRRAYRELLLTAPGLGDYISGAILYDETLRQSASDGTAFPELARERGIIPGIKVDTGAKDLAGHPGEKVTEGLDGLRERLAEYSDLGARFAKWRAVITIGDGIPSRACLEANAHALARYAALCQEAGLVPIVEPEVLLDGDHSIERCFEITRETQNRVFSQLYRQGVELPGIVLKPSMVLPGKDHSKQTTPERVAEETLRCLRNTVPAAVPGVAFLSGGQSDLEATEHLNLMNKQAKKMQLPWRVTFSYARALQHVALTTWRGDKAKLDDAQQALLHRAKCNSAASRGEYNDRLEHELAA
ncbi:fructose-bisphosphate aldolase [Candidatus Tenderia electrophaga]|jgi:fructose-bisphosphate aldolase class I|uniref:Probable fructose-bisphosphate aldolase class 1 n=1 Tax=Candidatus Tenderia electrophaga TaxID=1748243 RepID=A0A0S2TDW6_9GAMM|nr:fructose-bisphosphate aldolase [Candidatus Tenderia electrophaga]